MTKPVLILIHGRAQGGKDEAKLRELWIETLRLGLGPERAARLKDVDIRFPYYGDVLDDLIAKSAALSVDAVARGVTSEIEPAFAEFQLEIAEAARQKRKITDDQIIDATGAAVIEKGPLQWGWIQAILKTLDRIPGLSGDMIERFTRDAWIYLHDDHVRRTINALVAKTIKPNERAIVVAHSLGSIVAFDVLRATPNLKIPLLVTIGSPLGFKPIKRRLVPIKFPAGVDHWFNAYDERDAVALYPLDAGRFPIDPPIENFNEVENGTDNAHGIIGYLNNSVLADRIFNGLFP